jgi:hypothetical protein
MDKSFTLLEMLRRFRDVADKSRDMRRDFGDVQAQVKDLTDQVERLTYAVVALAEILRDQHGTSAAAINSKISEVALRGETLRREAKRCARCGRVSSPGRTACMFCDAPLPDEPFMPEQHTGPSSDAITR